MKIILLNGLQNIPSIVSRRKDMCILYSIRKLEHDLKLSGNEYTMKY